MEACFQTEESLMAFPKQIAWRKKFARMSKAGKFKKSKKSKSNPHQDAHVASYDEASKGKRDYFYKPIRTKKSNPHGKTESIAQLEKKLDMMLQKGGFDIHGNFKAKYDPQFLAGIEKLQKLKRK